MVLWSGGSMVLWSDLRLVDVLMVYGLILMVLGGMVDILMN